MPENERWRRFILGGSFECLARTAGAAFGAAGGYAAEIPRAGLWDVTEDNRRPKPQRISDHQRADDGARPSFLGEQGPDPIEEIHLMADIGSDESCEECESTPHRRSPFSWERAVSDQKKTASAGRLDHNGLNQGIVSRAVH